MASAVQFEAKLKELIDVQREQAAIELIGGGPEDYAAYRETVGFIRGLDTIDHWCVEAFKQLDER